jgi:hypothetical protein
MTEVVRPLAEGRFVKSTIEELGLDFVSAIARSIFANAANKVCCFFGLTPPGAPPPGSGVRDFLRFFVDIRFLVCLSKVSGISNKMCNEQMCELNSSLTHHLSTAHPA